MHVTMVCGHSTRQCTRVATRDECRGHMHAEFHQLSFQPFPRKHPAECSRRLLQTCPKPSSIDGETEAQKTVRDKRTHFQTTDPDAVFPPAATIRRPQNSGTGQTSRKNMPGRGAEWHGWGSGCLCSFLLALGTDLWPTSIKAGPGIKSNSPKPPPEKYALGRLKAGWVTAKKLGSGWLVE